MRQAGPRVTRPKAARQVWSRASESSPRRSHAAELATASAAEGSSGSGHADDRLVARPSENAERAEMVAAVGSDNGRGWGETWSLTAPDGLSGGADGLVAVEFEQVVRRCD